MPASLHRNGEPASVPSRGLAFRWQIYAPKPAGCSLVILSHSYFASRRFFDEGPRPSIAVDGATHRTVTTWHSGLTSGFMLLKIDDVACAPSPLP
jgi:hypothetical protein